MVKRAARHADTYFAEQAPVDAKEEAPILVVTSDCQGVPMRRHGDEPRPKRLGKGEKHGRKRMACAAQSFRSISMGATSMSALSIM